MRLSLLTVASVCAVLSPNLACQTKSGGGGAGVGDAVERAASPAPIRTGEPGVGDAAEGGDAIVYRLRFPEPHTHYVEVEAAIPAGWLSGPSDAAPELFMAVWTPGSYLVREYSRHVEALRVTAADGRALAVEKVRKNRWRVGASEADLAAAAGVVTVSYRVYAREMSVRTNFVDSDVAVLNGAPTFISVRGREGAPHEVIIEPAEGWPDSVTGLSPHRDGAEHHYRAADYDQLVDSPIVVGEADIHSFDIDGVPHRVATFLADERWDSERVASDIESIVAEHVSFWGEMPYRDYVFLFVLSSGGGGLEHKNSTLMLGNPRQTMQRQDYVRWLGLTSHEFFHTWNGKRLRPEVLGPFDYENEVYTRLLWVVEGVTSYYDDLLLRRAGLIDDAEYLTELSRRIERLESHSGRLVQSLADSSFDAWIKYYRPDENSANTAISYYDKGAVVAFLLDVEIRRRSQGRRDLRDLMRRAYREYSGPRGFTVEDFRVLADEVAGSSLEDFFARAVDSAEPLDYEPALAYLGLQMKGRAALASSDSGAQPGGDDDDEIPGWLGASVDERDGRVTVTRVERDTPAFAAGVNVGDEIVAIDEHRVPSAGLAAGLRYYRPGQRVSLLIARRGVLRRIEAELGRVPEARWVLERGQRASARQRTQRQRWLEGS